MVFWFFVFAILAVAAYNLVVYRRASGTAAQRLAAAWRGSLTIFVAIWGTITTYFIAGLDQLAVLTGQPEFKTIADGVTRALTPGVQEWIAAILPAALAGLVVWARFRTLGKPAS